MRSIFSRALPAFLLVACSSVHTAETRGVAPGELFTYPLAFTTHAGEAVDIEAGRFFVAAQRKRKESAVLSLAYYRLKSTAREPSSPIFLLIGGPGASGIDDFREDAEGQREVLFLRQIADVVIYDQRGAGHAYPVPTCPQRLDLPLDRVVDEPEYLAALRKAASACRAYWRHRGVDLDAYSTAASVEDLFELRAALGYDRLALVGGSYGSHLAFAVMRQRPGIVARAMLRGIEGPDQTYDMPSGSLNALRRIAADAERSPALKDLVPAGGLIEAFGTVQARLQAEPARVTVEIDGRPTTVTIGPFDVRASWRHGASRRPNLTWAANVIAMYRGDFRVPAAAAVERRRGDVGSAMFYMMDCASGITRGRAARITSDANELAAQRIIGDINNDYFATCPLWNAPDLGDEFRANVISDIPLLLFQGTWDVSTPYENALEILDGLRHATLVTVEGGTHSTFADLYREWPEMTSVVAAFLRGRSMTPPVRIQLPSASWDPGQRRPDTMSGQ